MDISIFWRQQLRFIAWLKKKHKLIRKYNKYKLNNSDSTRVDESRKTSTIVLNSAREKNEGTYRVVGVGRGGNRLLSYPRSELRLGRGKEK